MSMAVWVIRITRALTADIRLTCPPSPCVRLSRTPWWGVTPTTTMGTPSPWGSPPLGDPAFRAGMTFRTVAGAPVRGLEVGDSNLVPWERVRGQVESLPSDQPTTLADYHL